MCGIFFSAHHHYANSRPSGDDFKELVEKLRSANAARGPDSQGSHRIPISLDGISSHPEEGTLDLQFYASELWLRGETPVIQPHEREGDVLCWNGEIFDGMDVSPKENDGLRLFDKLRSLDAVEQIRDLLGSIEGPYALVYYQSRTRRLIFSKDPLGRRSLLIHKPTPSHPYLFLASVSAGVDSRYAFEEVSTDSIFVLALSDVSRDLQKEFNLCLVSFPRSSPLKGTPFDRPVRVNTSLPLSGDVPSVESLAQVPEHLSHAVDDFIHYLDRSVMLRVRDIPQHACVKGLARLAVLFSGGIDSTVITLLAHNHMPLDEPIDLLNVSFENPRKTKVKVEGNFGGISKRQKKGGREKDTNVDLVNQASYDVPDRITGLEGLSELRRLCPGRVWNFVEINVPYGESRDARQSIESLMLPVRTVMDLSLGLALYFASRGVGHLGCLPSTKPVPYTSSARVLLSGLGSDELLGGYGRHRSAYNAGGWQSVITELQSEIDRIPTRNLGRDDRVISSHGKETRHPFLSLTVVNFLAALPVYHKMDPRLEIGFGDKMLLRLVAWKLGLHRTSQRKKRAMQFGSHSARMDGERRGDIELE